jgi:hypothetical protein
MPEKESRPNKAGAEIDFRELEAQIDREIDNLFVPSVHGAGKAKREAEVEGPSQFNPDLRGQFSGPPPADLNLEALQGEIDKEIDNLFVPAVKPRWDQGPGRTPSRQEPEKEELKTAAVQAKNLSAGHEKSVPFIRPVEAASGAKYQTPPEDAFDSRKYQMQELSRLIETFNAAYLSVDWDLSQNNIQRLIVALHQLEPYAARASESKSVFKILDAILRRLHDRPNAVNSRLVQLIRDSQGLLAHMLLIDGNIGRQEKLRLRDLIERFQELRQRALAAKAETKKRDFSPSPISVPMEAQTAGTAEPVADAVEAGEKIQPAPQLSPEVRRENLCLMVFYGKCLALPVSCVLKVARSPDKTCQKILKRGFATLNDFKPFFRRIENGVLGEWAQMNPEELKSYEFIPMGPHSPDQLVTGGPMAVLASDGQTHMVIFCEIVNFIADTEIIDGSQIDGPLGSFENKSHLLVPVFNPRSPLSIPNEKAQKTVSSSGGS